MKTPPTTGTPSTILSGNAGNRRGAGPFSTCAPFFRSNSEKWQGHFTTPAAGCQSHASHPVWVHTAE